MDKSGSYMICGAQGFDFEQVAEKLTAMVFEAMAEGWVPQGGLAHNVIGGDDWANRHYFAQAMVRPVGGASSDE